MSCVRGTSSRKSRVKKRNRRFSKHRRAHVDDCEGAGEEKNLKKKKKRSTAGRRSCRYLMGARNLYTRVLWALVRAPCVRARNYTGRHGPVTGDGAKIEFRRRRFSSLSNRQNFRARRTRKRPALPRRIKVMNEKFFFLPVRPSW